MVCSSGFSDPVKFVVSELFHSRCGTFAIYDPLLFCIIGAKHVNVTAGRMSVQLTHCDNGPSGSEGTKTDARFTEEQTVKILRKADKSSVSEAAKKHRVSGVTIYA
jgi:hypothetical protein